MENIRKLIANNGGNYRGTIRLCYDGMLSRWFYVDPHYTSGKPEFLYSARGSRLKDRLISALLLTNSEFHMKTTDAEAVLANFFFFPGEQRLKRLFPESERLLVLRVQLWHILLFRLSGLVRRYDGTGASGLYAGRWLSDRALKRICSESSLPVICATGPGRDEISSKIEAGASALCLRGQDISKNRINSLHEAYPYIPVIASCGRSKKTMLNSVKAGVNAVIFKPFILLEPEFLSYEKRFLSSQE